MSSDSLSNLPPIKVMVWEQDREYFSFIIEDKLLCQKKFQNDTEEFEAAKLKTIHMIALEANHSFDLYGKNTIFHEGVGGCKDYSCFFSLFEQAKEREERKAAEKLAREDSLTGLLNKRALAEALLLLQRQEKRQEHEEETKLATIIAFIDLDFFKKVNDKFGHDRGDDILKILSNTLKSHLRPLDLAFRIGGDEFIIVFKVGPTEAIHALERIQKEFKNKTGVSFSAGVTVFKSDDTPESCKKRADEALYRSKERGRGIIVSADD